MSIVTKGGTDRVERVAGQLSQLGKRPVVPLEPDLHAGKDGGSNGPRGDGHAELIGIGVTPRGLLAHFDDVGRLWTQEAL